MVKYIGKRVKYRVERTDGSISEGFATVIMDLPKSVKCRNDGGTFIIKVADITEVFYD